MIAEVIPDAYDAEGKKVFRPFDRRRGPRPTYPLGRYVSQPLTVHCKSIAEIRNFLTTCKYVSDKELFDKDEYWQPPEDFEIRNVDPADIAYACADLGDKEQTFEWLDKAVAEKSGALEVIKVVPTLDPWHSDPRYLDILKRLGLTP